MPRENHRRLGASAVLFVCYTVLMLLVDRGMRKTGGPGIIPFELAGTAARAEEIMTTWGGAGQRAARLSLWLDFGYMLTYGTLAALLVDTTRRRRGGPVVLQMLVIGAVAGDAVEGIALLKVLDRADLADNARRARLAALIKFALLGLALGYVAAGHLRPRWQGQGIS